MPIADGFGGWVARVTRGELRQRDSEFTAVQRSITSMSVVRASSGATLSMSTVPNFCSDEMFEA
jgi:hypothetical protein